MAEEKPLNFVLVGRSGCGKGTQAELLMKHFGNLVPIPIGSLFRELSSIDTDVGRRVRKTVAEGKLPYDDLAAMLWMHYISFKIREDQGIIADGLPRRLSEAKTLDQFLDYLERKDSTRVLSIEISRQEAFDRLTKRRSCESCGRLIPWVGEFKSMKVCDKCGGRLVSRHDDVPEVIKNRLDYDSRVTKVVGYYEEQGKLIRINGEQPIDDVFQEILKAVR